MTRTLVDLSVPFVYYRLDQLANGAAVSAARQGVVEPAVTAADRHKCRRGCGTMHEQVDCSWSV